MTTNSFLSKVISTSILKRFLPFGDGVYNSWKWSKASSFVQGRPMIATCGWAAYPPRCGRRRSSLSSVSMARWGASSSGQGCCHSWHCSSIFCCMLLRGTPLYEQSGMLWWLWTESFKLPSCCAHGWGNLTLRKHPRRWVHQLPAWRQKFMAIFYLVVMIQAAGTACLVCDFFTYCCSYIANG